MFSTFQLHIEAEREHYRPAPGLTARLASDEILPPISIVLGELSGPTSPASPLPLWDDETAGDTAVETVMEEEPFQTWSDDSTTERNTAASSKENTGEAQDLSFLKQLWKIASSNEFPSIQWVDDGWRFCCHQ